MNISSVSFSASETSKYMQFFQCHGYVVIRDVLTPQQIEESLNEIYNSPNYLKCIPNFDMNDPETFENDNWPLPPENKDSKGFFSSLGEFDDVCAWNIRQNPVIVKVFQEILGEKLWSVMGRHGIMRPTKNIRLPNGTTVSKPHWKTASSWLHWDQNPWREPGFVRVQGIVTLTDHTITSGGFCCVPGFHKQFEQWGKDNPIESVSGAAWMHGLINVPLTDPVQDQKCAVLMKAGSLIVWDSRLPHQNYPNNDDTWRIVQYNTYSEVKPEEELKKQEELTDKILEGLTGSVFPSFLTDLGRKLVGLDLWDESSHSLNQKTVFKPVTLTPQQKQALNFLNEAKELESAGDPEKAIVAYRKALRLNPKLEKYFS